MSFIRAQIFFLFSKISENKENVFQTIDNYDFTLNLLLHPKFFIGFLIGDSKVVMFPVEK